MLRRENGVASELWNSVGRNVAPGATRRLDDDQLLVPLERFLATRNWIGQALTTYDCEAVLDDQLVAMLRREDDEREEVTRALAATTPPMTEDEVAALLTQSRFCRELRPFQLRDLGRMITLSHGANFSVPGAGKTTVAYATYELERVRGRVDRLLVVAPLSAFDAWFEEADESLEPTPRVARLIDTTPRDAEVVLVNYQRLAARYEQIAAWVLAGEAHVILDEAHRMKRGRGGEWGSASLNLAHLAVRRDILTGTPAPQHPRDFEALMEFLWPHQARRILPAGIDIGEPPPSVMADVSRSLRPLFARTRKDELGLDAPVLRVELVAMKSLQAEIYDAMRSRMRRAVRTSMRERTMFSDLGGVVMYLLEAATHPALLATAIGGQPSRTIWPPDPIPEGSRLAERVLAYARYETPAKFEKLAAMVATNAAAGRKTLVWSNFVANLLELERLLEPYRPALIYGGVPSGEEVEGVTTREREIRRFREEVSCLVLLANPAAMSEGVSLHHVCHDAIYVDRTFNAGHYLQSLDRIHRLGLAPDTETRITFLVSMDSIDETVDDRVAIKAERLGTMLSDPNLVTMALPDEESYGSWVEPDDLDALLAHLGRDN